MALYTRLDGALRRWRRHPPLGMFSGWGSRQPACATRGHTIDAASAAASNHGTRRSFRLSAVGLAKATSNTTTRFPTRGVVLYHHHRTPAHATTPPTQPEGGCGGAQKFYSNVSAGLATGVGGGSRRERAAARRSSSLFTLTNLHLPFAIPRPHESLPPTTGRATHQLSAYVSVLKRHVRWWGGGGRETDTTSSVRPWSHAAGHHLICYTLPSVSAWESAAAISITYRGEESFILSGSNPESIDERVGGGGGQCEVVELGRAWCEVNTGWGQGSRPGVEPGSPRA